MLLHRLPAPRVAPHRLRTTHRLRTSHRLAMEAPQQVGSNKHFGGHSKRFKHSSTVLGCDMFFTIFFPPAAESGQKVPVLYYLSGLTCNDENFTQKAGAQRAAAQHGVALIAPDTSPRGLNIPGESESYDFGVGAGFYLNATQAPWNKNWKMYDYITMELPSLLASSFPDTLDTNNASISGHSMGGHGALTIALKNPDKYKSVSAFSPICNPTQVPWGIKAFTGYLGADEATWAEYDAVELIKKFSGPPIPLLVDTGSADSFLESHLKPERLEAVLMEKGWTNASVRMQDGYDHSYYFISTFIEDHVAFHAKALKASSL